MLKNPVYKGRSHLEGNVREWVRPVQFLLTVGWYVALSLIIPAGMGYWLDRPEVWDRRPLFTLIGLVSGRWLPSTAYLACSAVLKLSKMP